MPLKAALMFFETQTGTRLKALRSDGEFATATLLSNYAAKKGFIIKTSPRDEPRANSTNERDHRTANRRAVAMRLDSHLPEQYWEIMRDTERVVRNLTPLTSGSLKGMTPYEATLKRGYPKGFLQPIGCLAWIRHWSSKKNQEMAYPGTMVGYDLHRRLYRIAIRGATVLQDKIVVKRDVRFNPSVRGYDANVEQRPWQNAILPTFTTRPSSGKTTPQLPVSSPEFELVAFP